MSIDLGKKMSLACPAEVAPKPEQEKLYYPSLYLENVKGLPVLPESGTLTVRFSRTSVSATKREGGDYLVCVTLDIKSIEDVTPDKPKRKSQMDSFEETAKEVFSARGY